MKRLLSLCIIISFLTIGFSQTPNPYSQYFAEAYRLHPSIPAGMLEAVAYTQTRINHIQPIPSCQDLPVYYGVMGLVEDGKGYFQNSLLKVAELSGYSVADIKRDPRTNILAYAKAYEILQRNKQVSRTADGHRPVIQELSEIPDDQSAHNSFALDQQFYSVLKEIENPAGSNRNRTRQVFDYNRIFGRGNFEVLSAPAVRISANRIVDDANRSYVSPRGIDGATCTASKNKTDYASAVWVAANSRNYSSRGDEKVTYITIHTIQGSYASAISWFKNRNARVSTHYVIRASDGQVTQMVCEDDKAFHVKTDNARSIGIEHEGFIDEGASWYSQAMYESSARLVRDIAKRHGINTLKMYSGPPTRGVKTLGNTCYHIKGHQHFRGNNHVDPGPYWDWDRFYQLVNDAPDPIVMTDRKGSFYDAGKTSGNYGDQARIIYQIQPANATRLTLKFKEFEMEGNAETPYDYLDIYDGLNNNGKFLGRFTGNQLPPDVICETGAAFIEFRSDCQINKKGWHIEYESSRKKVDCETPDGLMTSNLFPMGATVSWNRVSGANMYLLYVRRKNLEPKWTLYKTRNTSVTVTGLGADGLYQYQLQAICGDDTSALVGGSFLTSSVSRKGAPQVYTIRLNQGRFYDSGGKSSVHLNDEAWIYTIVPPNGSRVELSFSAFDTEEGEDILTIYDGLNDNAPILGAFSGSQLPPIIRSSGAALTVKFTSDTRITGQGWKATWKTIGGSTTPTPPVTGGPTTPIDPGPGTIPSGDFVPNLPFSGRSPETQAVLKGPYTESFLLSFDDTDKSGRGLANRFYGLAQQTNDGWWANAEAGFLYDDFEQTLNPEWKQVTGDWQVINGRLVQRDEKATNSNLYTSLRQVKNEVYIYHWQVLMDGSFPNKRSGIHFFCSDPAKSNRGNSYFIWARDSKSGDKIEIYRVANNAFDLKISKAYTFETGKAYDFKTIYNPVKGRIEVYVNNKFIVSWVDRYPLQSGQALSLRTGNSISSFDNIRVYKSRKQSLQMNVGSSSRNPLLIPGVKGRTQAFRVLSLIVDRNIRWSRVNTQQSTLAGGNTSTDPPTSSGGNPGTPTDPEIGDTPSAGGKFLLPAYSRDFTVNLNVPGADRTFYLISDFDGVNWRANTQAGMLADEFAGNTLDRAWITESGDWANSNRVLHQKNSAATNSNIFIPLSQTGNEVYLYHWRARLLTRGNNKRFGLHFFCSNGAQTNRGDSYMIWFRNHDTKSDQVEVYRSTGNQLSRILQQQIITLQPEQWYDCKVVYTPVEGRIEVYLNNQFVLDWRDQTSSLRRGNYLSLRTGSSQVQFDDVEVYRMVQNSQVRVTIGNGETDLARFRSIGNQPALRLKTIFQDRRGNWSEPEQEAARIE